MDTFGIKIAICIVSYRDKRIVDTINDAYEKAANKNNIRFLICIQDSYQYKVKKTEKDVLIYVPWDSFEGFNRHRHNLLNHAQKDEFIFFVSSATSFHQDWDIHLLENMNPAKDKFLYSIDRQFSLDGTVISKKAIDSLGYPNYLRMLGEEEEFSMRLYCNGYNIINIFNVIEVLDKKDYDYIPFSKTHNYDQVYKLYHEGYNEFINLKNTEKSFNDYQKQYPIKKIFHQLNDVEYVHSDIGKLKDERFYEHGSRI